MITKEKPRRDESHPENYAALGAKLFNVGAITLGVSVVAYIAWFGRVIKASAN